MRRWKPMVLSIALALVVLLVFVGRPAARAANPSRSIAMYVTSYGFDDNSPPSAIIAYPKDKGYPTLHNLAKEGKGAYTDPITFATDRYELAIGSIVYVPFLEKYFIMEDDCAACDSDWSHHHKYHIDLWMGPRSYTSPPDALYDCEEKITRASTTVVVDPATNLTVDTTPLFKYGKCTARIHQ